MDKKRDYILGLDLGVGSIGAAMVDVGTANASFNPDAIKTFVRIFDASTASTANLERRSARLQRRTTQRRAKRKKILWDKLFDLGLALPRAGGLEICEDTNKNRFGKDFVNSKNPWFLRFNGLRNPLAPFELGYALYHISNHRASSAIRDIGLDDKETGEIKTRVKNTQRLFKELQEEKAFRNRDNTAPVESLLTFGAALYYKQKTSKERFFIRNSGAHGNSEYFANRDMIRDELSKLLTKQKKYHPSLTDDAIASLIDIIDLESEKIVPAVTKCLYYPAEPKLPKAHPLAEKKRILESLNNTRIMEGTKGRHLTIEERQKLLDYLLAGNDLTPKKAFELLNLPATARTIRFPTRENDKGLMGDRCAYLASNNDFWNNLSLERKESFIETWITTPDDRALKDHLIKDFSLTDDQAKAVMGSADYLKLFPVKGDSYTAYGKSLTAILVDYLEHKQTHGLGKNNKNKKSENEHFLSNTEALEHAILDGKIQQLEHPIHDRLPYYGEVLREYAQDVVARSLHAKFVNTSPNKQKTNTDELLYGRIPNPVVHRTLNEVRKLVNAIIDDHGLPASIRVEYARELSMNEEDRAKLIRDQNKNEREDQALVQKLRDESGFIPTTKQLEAYRLTVKQNFTCAYSGQNISIAQIMNGEIDVDHILPYSRTLDDGQRNKVACFAYKNKDKGNKTPYEYFHNTPDWDIIQQLISADSTNWSLHSKSWRFAENAMEEFKRRNPFLNRYKTDNSYIAKAVTKYLKCLYTKDAEDKNNDKGTAIGVETFKSGALSQMRKAWGLNDVTWSFIKDALNTSEQEELDKKEKTTLGVFLAPKEGEPETTPKKHPKPKLRLDHRHHALDALVVALAKRGHQNIIQRDHGAGILGIRSTLADDEAKTLENQAFRDSDVMALERLIAVPYGLEAKDFRKKVQDVLANTVVSYRYDHGKESQLHEQTLYTIYPDVGSNYIALNKKKLEGLAIEGEDDATIGAKIRRVLLGATINETAEKVREAKEKNRTILDLIEKTVPSMAAEIEAENEQKRLEQVKKDEEEKEKERATLADATDSPKKGKSVKKTKVKRSWVPTPITPRKCWERAVKTVAQNHATYYQMKNLQSNTLFVHKEPTDDKSGIAYKAGNNYCLDLYHDKDGVLQGEIIRSYAANNPKFKPEYEKQGYQRLERLINGDVLEVDRFTADEGKGDVDGYKKMLSNAYTGAPEGRVYLRLLSYVYATGSMVPDLIFKMHHKSGATKDFNQRLTTFKDNNPRRVLLKPTGDVLYRSPLLVDKEKN